MPAPPVEPDPAAASTACLDPCSVLDDLVGIPSVNPRGAVAAAETPVARYVAEVCSELGLRVRLDEVLDGRCNVVAVLPGRSPEYLVLETHLDTVETAGMSTPPFRPVRRDGRIYGRGACDAKASLAAFLTALSRVAGGEPSSRGVVLVGAIDEEHRYAGVADVLRRGIVQRAGAQVIGAVVGEPTELSLVIAHKGCVRGQIVATGPGGHSSRPWNAANPIETVSEVVAHLRGVAAELAGRPLPLVGPPSLTTTLVEGGHGPNVLPESASITVDRRTVAGEEPRGVWEELKHDLESRWPGAVEVPPDVVDFALDGGDAGPDERAGGFAELVQQHLRAAGLDATGIGVGHGTDASKFARAGIPAVVFGPGSMAQAHTSDEYVDTAQLTTAATALTQLLRAEP